MKLTKKYLGVLVEEVLNEQPPKPPQKKPAPPAPPAGDDTEPKKLKIDIPDTPFSPDVSQIKSRLKDILGSWQNKKYPSDAIRWKEYYTDIVKLVKKLEGNSDEV